MSEEQPIIGGDADPPLDPENDLSGSGRIDKRPSGPNRRDSVGRISLTGVNFQIPTNAGAKEHVMDKHGEESWSVTILHFLHDNRVQTFLMILLLLDVLILFTEIFLLAEFPPCVVIRRDCISCCPASTDNNGGNDLRWLAADDYGPICPEEDGLSQYPPAETGETQGGCDPNKWSTVHTIEEVLFALTITILTIFFIELNLEMIALRPKVFFRQFFYLLDYFIITVSIALELTFHFADQEALQAYIGILVLFRIWRFVRIGHGIVEITAEWTHKQYEVLLDYTEELEEIVKKQGIELPEAASKINRGSHSGGHSGGGSSTSSSSPGGGDKSPSHSNVGELPGSTKFYDK